MPIKSTKALIFIWLLILAGNSFLFFSPTQHSTDDKQAISAVNVKLITDAFAENSNPGTDNTLDPKIDSNSNNFAIYLGYLQHTTTILKSPFVFKNSNCFSIKKSRAPPVFTPA